MRILLLALLTGALGLDVRKHRGRNSTRANSSTFLNTTTILAPSSQQPSTFINTALMTTSPIVSWSNKTTMTPNADPTVIHQTTTSTIWITVNKTSHEITNPVLSHQPSTLLTTDSITAPSSTEEGRSGLTTTILWPLPGIPGPPEAPSLSSGERNSTSESAAMSSLTSTTKSSKSSIYTAPPSPTSVELPTSTSQKSEPPVLTEDSSSTIQTSSPINTPTTTTVGHEIQTTVTTPTLDHLGQGPITSSPTTPSTTTSSHTTIPTFTIKVSPPIERLRRRRTSIGSFV